MRVRQAKSYLRSINVLKDESSKWKKLQEAANCFTAGSLRPVDEDEFSGLILGKFRGAGLLNLRKAQRILKDSQRLFAEDYTRMKKRACNVVLLENGTIASVKYFVVCPAKVVYAVLSIFCSENRNVVHNFSTGLHLQPVRKTDEMAIVSVDDICERLLLMTTKSTSGHNMFVARLPNIHGHSIFK